MTSQATDSDPHCGDSVLFDFERDGLEVELELYGDGRLVAWPLDVPADETSDPLWVLPDATGDQARVRFEESGWI